MKANFGEGKKIKKILKITTVLLTVMSRRKTINMDCRKSAKKTVQYMSIELVVADMVIGRIKIVQMKEIV